MLVVRCMLPVVACWCPLVVEGFVLWFVCVLFSAPCCLVLLFDDVLCVGVCCVFVVVRCVLFVVVCCICSC